MEVTFWYSNLTSIVNKTDEWAASINKFKPTCILITETWLHSKIPDSLICLPGYSISREDREDKVGGGVCILIKEYLNGQKIYSSINTKYSTELPIQSLWINIKINSSKFMISCIYRPDYSTEDTDMHMANTLTQACKENMPVIVMGDFNYRNIDWKKLTLLNPDKKSEQFLSDYLKMNAHQIVPFHTRFRNDQSSLLDLILVNEKRLIFDLQNDPPIGKSDHIVIRCKAQFEIAIRATRKLIKRNFWKADYEAVNTYLAQKDFNPQDLNQDHFHRCMEILTETINKFVPLESTKTNSTKPWLTPKIFKGIELKRKHWDKHIKNPQNEELRSQYRVQNNRLKNEIRQSRIEYENRIASTKSSKNFFRYVNRSLNSKITTITLKNSPTNEMITSDLEVGEKFAEYFNKVFSTEDDEQDLPFLPNEGRSMMSITEINFTTAKVKEAIMDLKAESSPGLDNIPAIFLQRCSDVICGPLSELMTELQVNGRLPDLWKSSIVTPLFKKGDRHLPSNYRPISLTSNLCKCMEKVIVKELTPFLLDDRTIPQQQHGFLPGRSTITNLTTCLEEWTKSFDNNIQTDVVYLDFEKAFDKVCHGMLLHKLEHHGIRGNLLKIIESFLRGRTYQIRVNGTLSKPHSVLSGVPQGSVLGPLLFLVFVGDLVSNIKSRILFFADDTKLYANPNTNHFQLQQDLTTVEAWAKKWKMKLNEEKCTILSIGSNSREYPYVLHNALLKHVEEQNDLGIIITSNLKWEVHISKIVKKANSFSYAMQKAFQERSCDTILGLYKSFIRPKLEYGQSIWSPYFVKDIELLERCQRRITKLPTELLNEEYQTRLRILQLTTLKERRVRGDLIETFKLVSNYYTCNMNILQLSSNIHLRGHSRKLDKEKCAKLPRKNFLTNRVVYLWNALSEETVTAPSVNIFKNRLDKELSVIINTDSHYGP